MHSGRGLRNGYGYESHGQQVLLWGCYICSLSPEDFYLMYYSRIWHNRDACTFPSVITVLVHLHERAPVLKSEAITVKLIGDSV